MSVSVSRVSAQSGLHSETSLKKNPLTWGKYIGVTPVIFCGTMKI